MRADRLVGVFVTAVLVLTGAAGCARSPAASTSTAAPGVADLVRTAATRAAPVEALNDAARRHRADAGALTAVISDRDPSVRRAGAYVAALWADDQQDVATLSPLLGDDDVAIRAMVAGSLAGLGDRGARTTLESLVGSTVPMPWSDPVITVGQFAAGAIRALDSGAARP
jgi:HEAT repeat protein